MAFSLESKVKSNFGDILRDVAKLQVELRELHTIPTDLKFDVNARSAGASARQAGAAINREAAKAARQQVDLQARADREMRRERERTNRATQVELVRQANATARQQVDIANRASRDIANNQARAARDSANATRRAADQAARDSQRRADQAARDAQRRADQTARAQQQAAQRAARELQRIADQQRRDQERAARDAQRLADQTARAQQRAAEQAARAQQRAAREAARAQQRADRETQAAARRAANERIRDLDRQLRAALRLRREEEARRRGLINDGKAAAGRLADQGSQTATAGGMAIAGGLFLATREAIKFEDAFTGVTKTVNASDAQLAKLSKEIRQMATEIPVGTTELSNIAQSAGQLGIEFGNLGSFTKVIAALGVSTNLASEDGATSLARYANITKMSQAEFENLGSSLVDLGNNFATTEAEIMEMSLRLASAGSLAGISKSAILGFATALSSMGINAEAGGTAMSKVFAKFEQSVRNSDSKLKVFAKTSGVSIAEFKRRFNEDATGAIVLFIQGLNKLKESGGDVNGTLRDVGMSSVYISNAMRSLASNPDLLVRALKKSDDAWKENTALANEAGKRYATTGSRVRIAENELKEFGITVGETIVPTLTNLLKLVKPTLDRFNNLSKEAQNNTVKWLAFAAVGLIVIGRLKGMIETAILLRTAFIGLRTAIIAAGGAGTIAGRAITLAFGPVGIALAALAITVWGVRTAFIGTGDAGSMAADKLIKKWGRLGLIWDQAGRGLGRIYSYFNGSQATFDATTDKQLALINKSRKKKGQRPLTRDEYQQDPNAGEADIDGSHAHGLERVPFDGYRAELHRDEAVLTAEQADLWRESPLSGIITRASAVKVPKFPTNIPAPPPVQPYVAPMSVSNLKPHISSATYKSRGNEVETQIDNLQSRIDDRVLARVGKKGKKADLQLTKWRIELRKLKERRADLRKLETQARSTEKADQRARNKALPDVSLRSLIPNLSLRDTLENPNSLEVAMALAKINQEGLTLPRQRDAAHAQQWKIADYTSSPRFQRDLKHAKIPDSAAKNIQHRLFAEAQVIDKRKEKERLDKQAIRDAAKLADIQTKLTEDVTKQQQAQVDAIELASMENRLLAEGKLSQEEITRQVDEERTKRERIVDLISRGARPEQATDIANQESGRRAYQYTIGKANDRQREDREYIEATNAAIAEAFSEATSLKSIVKEASESLKAILDEPDATAADFKRVLASLPDAVLNLESAAKEAERNGDPTLARKHMPFLALLRNTRKIGKQTADFETFESMFEAPRDSIAGVESGLDASKREYKERNMRDSERLRLQSARELKAVADAMQATALDPDAAVKASAEYRIIADRWQQIVISQAQFEAQQSKDRAGEMMRGWLDDTRSNSILDPVAREIFELKRQLKTDGWTDEEIEAIVPARRAALKAQDMQGRVNTALEGIRGALSDSFGRIKDEGLGAFATMFDGILNSLNQFAAQYLADQVWQQLLQLGTSLLGGSGGGSGYVGKGAGPWAGGYVPHGSHRTGLERVPFDGYRAELHAGERVLTATEANNYDWKMAVASSPNNEWKTDGGSGGSVTVVNNHYYTIGQVRANDPNQFNQKMPGNGLSKAQMKREMARANAEGQQYT